MYVNMRLMMVSSSYVMELSHWYVSCTVHESFFLLQAVNNWCVLIFEKVSRCNWFAPATCKFLKNVDNYWVLILFSVSSATIPLTFILQTVGRKCFEKCVTKPGSSLGGSESSCISRCVDRYIEATGIISKALFSSQWNGQPQ